MPVNDEKRSTLSAEDTQKLAATRQSVQNGGIRGFVVGSLCGISAYQLNGFLLKLPLTRNHLVMMILLGGAVGMTIGSYAGGVSTSHNLYSVFRRQRVSTTV